MGVRLFTGGHAWSIDGEKAIIDGYRMFSPVHAPPPGTPVSAANTVAMLDSGAFSDPPERRLSPADALVRQLDWERRAARYWNTPGWIADYIVSYDLLIDEVWRNGRRVKERWTVDAARDAVERTVEAAAWMGTFRDAYEPRTPVFAVQGVDAGQYVDCLERIIPYTRPGDVIGFGGWCILGRWTSWMSAFALTVAEAMPIISQAGIRHVHIFGVLYPPALGVLLYHADRYGIRVSTDSAAPVKQCIGANHVKSGRRRAYWRDNIAYWHDELANLRASRHYAPYPIQAELAIAW